MTKKIIRVEPLRTNEEIEEMKLAIRRGNGAYPKNPEIAKRDVLLFLVGINTGLRINDLLRLTVGDVRDKNHLIIHEGKTRKRRDVNLAMIRKEIDDYIDDKPNQNYLFQSQKGMRPITTVQAYRILQGAGAYVDRRDIGTHTMRKTFGYHHYKQYRDVAMLQEIFNHSAPSITRRYIGIRQDEINHSLENFRLG